MGYASNSLKKNQQITTRNRLDLRTLGIWRIVANNLPGHCDNTPCNESCLECVLVVMVLVEQILELALHSSQCSVGPEGHMPLELTELSWICDRVL